MITEGTLRSGAVSADLARTRRVAFRGNFTTPQLSTSNQCQRWKECLGWSHDACPPSWHVRLCARTRRKNHRRLLSQSHQQNPSQLRLVAHRPTSAAPTALMPSCGMLTKLCLDLSAKRRPPRDRAARGIRHDRVPFWTSLTIYHERREPKPHIRQQTALALLHLTDFDPLPFKTLSKGK